MPRGRFRLAAASCRQSEPRSRPRHPPSRYPLRTHHPISTHTYPQWLRHYGLKYSGRYVSLRACFSLVRDSDLRDGYVGAFTSASSILLRHAVYSNPRTSLQRAMLSTFHHVASSVHVSTATDLLSGYRQDHSRKGPLQSNTIHCPSNGLAILDLKE